jgi:F-type H+-transporting ATPase subunit gamma
MPSLKDLRNRITSVKSTQKITRAMQMVSAAKLRRAQEAAEQARPYSDRMAKLLASVTANLPSLEGAPPMMVGTGNDQTHLLLVITAERGLCGSFNTTIARAVRRHLTELTEAGKTVKILCVGKKGYDNLKRDFESRIIEFISLREVRNPGFEDAHAIARRLMALFEAGEYDVCTIFFNAFKSVVSQLMTTQQLIPLAEAEGEEHIESVEEPEGVDLRGAIHEFEPEEDELLAALVPRNLSVQVFKALLESAAAEQAARMTAMDSATRNAGDMIDKLTLNYNRTRQAAITKELIEIVSGAEAL